MESVFKLKQDEQLGQLKQSEQSDVDFLVNLGTPKSTLTIILSTVAKALEGSEEAFPNAPSGQMGIEQVLCFVY